MGATRSLMKTEPAAALRLYALCRSAFQSRVFAQDSKSWNATSGNSRRSTARSTAKPTRSNHSYILTASSPMRWRPRSLHWQRENKEEKMTVAELMHHNFDEIFIELDPVKREAMMRNAYTEDSVWIHPGGRLVGIAAINEAASEIRKRIPEYRYKV